MPRTIEKITHARTVHAALSELRVQRADLLVTMRRLDRTDTRLSHAKLGLAVSALDDTIASLEAGQ